jgi:hypothetical protein
MSRKDDEEMIFEVGIYQAYQKWKDWGSKNG